MRLTNCTLQPLGSYLKSLAVLRLVSTQIDPRARAWWVEGQLELECSLDRDSLTDFFLKSYAPTPVLGPWNAGSGFYPKDRTVGINALESSQEDRFRPYRESIAIAKTIVVKAGGKAAAQDEDGRRSTILRDCRNQLPDTAVEWLDAAIAISAEGKRAFAPILGTGGNEGRLDYTNNFMENLANLLLQQKGKKKIPTRELLINALWGDPTTGLQDIAVGQYDPGRAGGFNQGESIESGSVANPWNAVLTIEGAVAWAGGIYRKQGVSYRSFLCSPFTVRPSAVGSSSSTYKDEGTARAEVWTPVWTRPARYGEIRAFLREGRAIVGGGPAKTGFDFAQAVASLGVDRSVSSFVRYSMLKRRGDSYVATSLGAMDVKYRNNADRIRELAAAAASLTRAAKEGRPETPPSWAALQRAFEEASFQALLHDGGRLLLEAVAEYGAMLGWLLERGIKIPRAATLGVHLLDTCEQSPELRIAAALASMHDPTAGSLLDNVLRLSSGTSFSWQGRDLIERMASTLRRRVLAGESAIPVGATLCKPPGEKKTATLRSPGIEDLSAFLSGTTDDALIEKLTFALLAVKRWQPAPPHRGEAFVPPAFCLLKQMFRGEKWLDEAAGVRLKPEPSIPTLLMAGRVEQATAIASRRLRVHGLDPVSVTFGEDFATGRLAAALLIPVSKQVSDKLLSNILLSKRVGKEQEK